MGDENKPELRLYVAHYSLEPSKNSIIQLKQGIGYIVSTSLENARIEAIEKIPDIEKSNKLTVKFRTIDEIIIPQGYRMIIEEVEDYHAKKIKKAVPDDIVPEKEDKPVCKILFFPNKGGKK